MPALAASFACLAAPAQERGRPRDDDAATRAAATAINAFTCDLHRVHAAGQHGNTVASGWSVATALAMVRCGASGETAAALDRVLHVAGSEGAVSLAALGELLAAPRAPRGERLPFVLHVAHAAWVQHGLALVPRFTAHLTNDFAAPPRRVDFADTETCRAEIDGWVAEMTAGHVRNILPADQPCASTRLMLADAVHLRARWRDAFRKGATKPHPFTLANGERVEAAAMHCVESLGHASTAEVELVEKGFEGGLSLVVLLPRGDLDLEQLEGRLTGPVLTGWLDRIRYRQVDLTLPKFSFAAGAELTRALTAMGAGRAFDERADFSGITADEPLCVGTVLHRAFVEVDEEGVEAAATTVVGLAPTAAVVLEPVQIQTVRVDQPFLFLIRDRATGTVLFLGRCVDPRA